MGAGNYISHESLRSTYPTSDSLKLSDGSRLQRTVPGSASSPEEPEPRPVSWGKRCGKARRPRPPQEVSCGCYGSPDVSRASPDVVGRWAGPRTRHSIGSHTLPAEAFGSVPVPTTPVMELTPLTSLLRGHRVVLASTSPRRRDILELAVRVWVPRFSRKGRGLGVGSLNFLCSLGQVIR